MIKYNILIISSSDPSKTAGLFSLALRDGLEQKGHNVKFITKYPYQNNSYHHIISYYGNTISLCLRAYRKIKCRLFKYIIKNSDLKNHFLDTKQFFPSKNPYKFLKLAGFIPDAIIIFFAPEFINYWDMFLLNKICKCPIFVSTPDMYPFTGICHFSGKCRKYEDFCGACPAIGSKFKYDLSWLIMKTKYFLAKRTKLIALCWTEQYEILLNRSRIYKHKSIFRIPAFMYFEKGMGKPDKQTYYNLRDQYRINPNDYVLMICSVSLNSERKGIPDIIDAVNIVVKDPIIYERLVIVTAGTGDLPKKINTQRIINFGLVDYDKLADIYKLSDIFISASHNNEDVGPGTIPYSLICGVPVISYDTGIAPKVICNNKNGFIVKDKDIISLSEKISEHFYLSEEKKEYMSVNAAESVKYMFDYSFVNDLEKAIQISINKM